MTFEEKQKPVNVKHNHINGKLDPLIKDEIDLWIKENENIHHNDKNIVDLMREMCFYISNLTMNLYN